MNMNWYCGEDDFYFYLLSCAMNIGLKTYNEIQPKFGSLRDLFTCSDAAREKAGIFTKSQLAKLSGLAADKAKIDDFKKLESSGIKYICREHNIFPYKLKEIEDGPIGLFCFGKLPDDNYASIAVIGARECSFYGEEIAYSLGDALGKYKIQLISGMARGVDSISQRAALAQNGPSFGVLGGGVDICYPRESRRLYEDLKTFGGVISEYPPGTQPQAVFFVRRNRIISGLADEICVVEARKKSGTMITVDSALEQGRSVACIPGKITDATSRGCNDLIQQGAFIVTDVEEYAYECAKRYGHTSDDSCAKKVDTDLFLQKLTDEETKLVKILKDKAFSASDIAMVSKNDFAQILILCLSLCDKGILENKGAGQFALSAVGLKVRYELNK